MFFKKYASDVSKTIYGMAEDLYKYGDITGEEFQEYKDSCLVPLFKPKAKETGSETPSILPVGHL